MAELCRNHAQSVGELEEKVDSLQKAKSALEAQLDELRREVEAEANVSAQFYQCLSILCVHIPSSRLPITSPSPSPHLPPHLPLTSPYLPLTSPYLPLTFPLPPPHLPLTSCPKCHLSDFHFPYLPLPLLLPSSRPMSWQSSKLTKP